MDEADYGFRVPADGALKVSLDGRANDGQGSELGRLDRVRKIERGRRALCA